MSALTHAQAEARHVLDLLEAEARLWDNAPPSQYPLPWRVSKRGNVIARNGEVVCRPQGADRRERRRRARPLADAANAENVQREEALAVALDAARARWAEVAPPEPGRISFGGFEVEVPDMGRVSAVSLAAAINEASDGSYTAGAVHGGVVTTYHPPHSIRIAIAGGSQVEALGPALNFSRVDFDFVEAL